jgi:hypothetical protein
MELSVIAGNAECCLGPIDLPCIDWSVNLEMTIQKIADRYETEYGFMSVNAARKNNESSQICDELVRRGYQAIYTEQQYKDGLESERRKIEEVERMLDKNHPDPDFTGEWLDRFRQIRIRNEESNKIRGSYKLGEKFKRLE